MKHYNTLISFLTILSKFMEMVTNIQIFSFFEVIFTEHQFVFRKERNTSFSITYLVQAFVVRKFVELVCHNYFIHIIIHLRIKFFWGSLSFIIFANSVYFLQSQIWKLSLVVQTSMLGITFFLIYINNIGTVVRSTDYLLIADDICVLTQIQKLRFSCTPWAKRNLTFYIGVCRAHWH